MITAKLKVPLGYSVEQYHGTIAEILAEHLIPFGYIRTDSWTNTVTIQLSQSALAKLKTELEAIRN